MRTWGWLLQYGISMLLALLLGAILGSVPLFKEAALGGTKLTASHLVQFLGYGSALLLLWLAGQRAVTQIPEGKSYSVLRYLVLPLAALLVMAAGYKVVLLLLGPFLGKAGKTIYNWFFAIGIGGAALWLIVAWFQNSAAFIEGLGQPGRSSGSSSMRCPDCGAEVAPGMKFCSQCGQTLGARLSKTRVS